MSRSDTDVDVIDTGRPKYPIGKEVFFIHPQFSGELLMGRIACSRQTIRGPATDNRPGHIRHPLQWHGLPRRTRRTHPATTMAFKTFQSHGCKVGRPYHTELASIYCVYKYPRSSRDLFHCTHADGFHILSRNCRVACISCVSVSVRACPPTAREAPPQKS
ncbi:hypothetical protein K439DRAFT_78614 [Ramaria rubella]|nr:hypothetical protein K439DRAFT_78614 [Ramaria rubella]